LLRSFAACGDSQRAWLLLEDYFEKLSLSRKDFPGTDWWPQLLTAQGKARLEEVAFLFMRARRSVPTELSAYANLDRFAQVQQAAREQQHVRQLEAWLFPPKPAHFDGPRAFLRAVCRPLPDEEEPGRHRLAVQFHLQRPRTGEKVKTLGEIIELTMRAGHEQELFPPGDWEFIEWLAETHEGRNHDEEAIVLSDLELLHWLARWGQTGRLELVRSDGSPQGLEFHGEVAELTPHLENGQQELAFTHRLTVPGGQAFPLNEVRFFNRHPPLVLVGRVFYLLRNAPPPQVVEHWVSQPAVPMRKLSHRLLMHLRQTQSSQGVDWEQLCVAHPAKPQFVFELLDETVRLRLLARSQRDQSLWLWSGHEWQLHERAGGGPPPPPPPPPQGARGGPGGGGHSAARHQPAQWSCGRRRRAAECAPYRPSPRFWTTRAWSPQPSGCAGWIGSRPSPACGSATRRKAS
jgi:hypothetical protein